MKCHFHDAGCTVNNKITPPPNLPGRNPLWLRTQRECLQAWNKELWVSGSLTANGHTSAKKEYLAIHRGIWNCYSFLYFRENIFPKQFSMDFICLLLPFFLERKIDTNRTKTSKQQQKQTNRQNHTDFALLILASFVHFLFPPPSFPV